MSDIQLYELIVEIGLLYVYTQIRLEQQQNNSIALSHGVDPSSTTM